MNGSIADQAQGADIGITQGGSRVSHRPISTYSQFWGGPVGLGAPEWKIDDRKIAYVTRAVAVRMGLWGNHGYEADYEILWQDGEGEFLDGSHTYELTLSPPPPAKAFWSLTMYDEPNYHLVNNPINRYSIGDRTPGLQHGADGSVAIYMENSSPGAGKESNWLPAPPGAFRPVQAVGAIGAASAGAVRMGLTAARPGSMTARASPKPRARARLVIGLVVFEAF
jgi:hypothetical protein